MIRSCIVSPKGDSFWHQGSLGRIGAERMFAGLIRALAGPAK
jgi:hypothetical protein